MRDGGKLFLAFLPENEKVRIHAGLRDLKRITANTITDRESLDTELETIRAQGYAVDYNELHEAYRSIAAPVRQAGGHVVAALCSGWWTTAEENHEETLLRELIPAAEEFSRVYGQFAPW